MITAGIDYGAGHTRCVVMRDGGIIGTGAVQTGFDLEKRVERSLAAAIRRAGIARDNIHGMGATGSGRFQSGVADVLIDDAEAVALAVRSFLPGVRTILDIGDERSLAARLDDDGRVVDVFISRECAAEAGVYLESIGRLLGADPEAVPIVPASGGTIPMNAQCLVFAEREIPGLIRAGFSPADIFKCAQESFAVHVASMVQRIGVAEEVVMTGVIGRDPSFIEAVRSRIEVETIHVPGLGAFAAAAGAASAAAARHGYAPHPTECIEDKNFVVLGWPERDYAHQGKREDKAPEARRWRDPLATCETGSCLTAGVDVGSVCAKACMMVDGRILSYVIMPAAGGREGAAEVFDTLLDTSGVSRERLDFCVGTGYGRVRIPFADRTITDTACHARGASFIYGPSVRTVLDVGGQEMKVMHCDEKGKVTDFLVNDKCAAGTGVGIEVFAGLLGVPVADVGSRSFEIAEEPLALPDTCVVHAWSRAGEMLAKGAAIEEVLAAFCRSCAERIHTLLEKSGAAPGLALTGGVGKNRGIVERLTPLLGYEPLKSAWDPQIAGAVGAALFGYKLCLKRKKLRERGDG